MPDVIGWLAIATLACFAIGGLASLATYLHRPRKRGPLEELVDEIVRSLREEPEAWENEIECDCNPGVCDCIEHDWANYDTEHKASDISACWGDSRGIIRVWIGEEGIPLRRFRIQALLWDAFERWRVRGVFGALAALRARDRFRSEPHERPGTDGP